MSSIDFANYLKNRMRILDMGPTEAARISGLTRQTWHKLLRAEVEEAKISTLRKLARALRTTPEHLLHIYFQEGGRSAVRLMEQDSLNHAEQVAANEQASYARLHRLAERRSGLYPLQG